jgi:hypothetical protein
MLQECIGCDQEFYEDDVLLVPEHDGGPVCIACLTKAEGDYLFATCLDLLLDDEGGDA